MLENFKVPVKLKLSALWTSVMFLYVYGDWIYMYTPGALDAMSEGMMGPLGKVTDEVLLGVAVLMAVPSVMIFLSLALPPLLSRWLNVLLGLAYTGVNLLMVVITTIPFFLFSSVAELVLTLLIVWYALTWPKQPTAAAG